MPVKSLTNRLEQAISMDDVVIARGLVEKHAELISDPFLAHKLLGIAVIRSEKNKLRCATWLINCGVNPTINPAINPKFQTAHRFLLTPLHSIALSVTKQSQFVLDAVIHYEVSHNMNLMRVTEADDGTTPYKMLKPQFKDYYDKQKAKYLEKKIGLGQHYEPIHKQEKPSGFSSLFFSCVSYLKSSSENENTADTEMMAHSSKSVKTQ